MILHTINSKGFLINLLAEFILEKINKNENTIIKVIDCINFIIVKGKTTSSDILDLSKISEEFNSKYSPDKKITHTIDLLEYNQELIYVDEINHTYFNSDNCSYHQNQINAYPLSTDFTYTLKEIKNDELVVCSQFPYGYSLGQGRLLYYYGKHIFYSLPPSYYVDCLTFKITKQKNENEDFDFHVYNVNGKEDDILTSAILDVFDFDMSSLENEIKKVDWSIELTDPLSEYDFIKKVNKDFVII
jgi:hypothetical protein